MGGEAAIFGALVALAGGALTYLLRKISELEKEVRDHEATQKRMLGVILRGSEDEEQVAAELARLITGTNGGERGPY